jgi:hypothetical protein
MPPPARDPIAHAASRSRLGGESGGIGFRVRTGNATAVVLGGPAASPRFLARLYIPLVDMDDDEARQPYHVMAEQDKERGTRLVRQTLTTATTRAAQATRGLIDRAETSGYDVRAAILVVGSDTNPASIRQPHVQAHALEGRLYREAVEAGLSQLGLGSRAIVEREVRATALDALDLPSAAVGRTLHAFGELAGRPWRAQDKSAALAAWMALR